jgi:hypothetical protein
MITIVVRNPVPLPSPTVRDGNRLALANIKRERLDLMYGERATVKAGRFDEEYIVTLRFPFTTNRRGRMSLRVLIVDDEPPGARAPGLHVSRKPAISYWQVKPARRTGDRHGRPADARHRAARRTHAWH